MMLIESQFELGQTVYLKTDDDQKPRIVKQICIAAKGMEFNLVNSTTSTWHSDFEISSEINILAKTGSASNEKQ